MLIWRVIGIIFYMISILLIWRYHKIKEILRKVNLYHIIVFSLIMFLIFSAVHAFYLTTIPQEQINNISGGYLNINEAYMPESKALLNGTNPWDHLNPRSILIVLITAPVSASIYCVVLLYVFAAFLIPILVYLISREYFKDNAKSTYAFLLALFIPINVFLCAREPEEDPFVTIAILGSILLLLKGKPLWSAIFGGVFAHTKFMSLFSTISGFSKKKLYIFYCIATFLIVLILTYMMYGRRYIDWVYLDVVFGFGGRTTDSILAVKWFANILGIGWYFIGAALMILSYLYLFYKSKGDCIVNSIFIMTMFSLVMPYNTVWYLSWWTPVLVVYTIKMLEKGSILFSPLLVLGISALADLYSITAPGVYYNEPMRVLCMIVFFVVFCALAIHSMRLCREEETPQHETRRKSFRLWKSVGEFK